MKKIIICMALFFGLNTAAFAEPQQSVEYADKTVPQLVDIMPSGSSIGDLNSKKGLLRSSIGGPVIGEFFTQSTLVYLKDDSNRTTWSFFEEHVYPDGSIYKMDLVQIDSGQAPKVGHKHEGAIIGGTGKYSGIRGSYALEVLEGGVTKVINTYWLGQ